MNAALILSGGSGLRFGGEVPKQYRLICGKPVIEYVIDAAEAAESINRVLIAARGCAELDAIIKRRDVSVAPAGDARNETLKRGLDALWGMGCERVVVLDAVRPLVTGALIDEYVALLDEYDAVATAQNITDSLGCYDARQVYRDRYYLLQSPEAFRFGPLYARFDPHSRLTEVTQQLSDDSRIKLYFDFPNNPKITYPWDLDYIEHIFKSLGR